MKNKLIYSLVAIEIFVSTVFAQDNFAGYCGGMVNGLYGSYGTSFMLISWIFYLAVIGLAIAGIFWLIKSAKK